ncbi:hypothetical protein [endosymbiont GvMRE of Glomus versiforme]|uniref:hypothetical protein n=1 Tax=endosymbiont GvMRE of Glomus versiforme TaxID=2039283 RepID=UPI000EDF685D|nr:hypothetical protein [endosymbiont GvMRE of Glomus versiforme]RHZ35757.1 hypothetical protein GvMRE_Ic6g37 [endosymbiont GvMRE of Glomus versiforme]RHZ35892.1 hypothetical protein GvMRE_Ic4g57 [endosymbiont GvMRE of Glomus versiforme]RHZ35919.1 hypothetical protein GvMRE_Ic4g96 [endosymbiont GvMRE of Glomus versiforme]
MTHNFEEFRNWLLAKIAESEENKNQAGRYEEWLQVLENEDNWKKACLGKARENPQKPLIGSGIEKFIFEWIKEQDRKTINLLAEKLGEIQAQGENVDNLTTQIQELQQKLNQQQQSEEVFRNNIEDLTNQLDTARQEFQEKIDRQKQELQSQINQLNQQNIYQQNQQTITNLNSSLTIANNTNGQLQTENQSLQTQLEQTKKDKEKVEKELVDLKQEHQELQNQVQALMAEISTGSQQMAFIQQRE